MITRRQLSAIRRLPEVFEQLLEVWGDIIDMPDATDEERLRELERRADEAIKARARSRS